MQSKAKTVAAYLEELGPERAGVVSAVREVVNRNLRKGFEEGMGYGMIVWSVPKSVYPPGYHCDPTKGVMFAAMAAQKGSYSLYLMCLYMDPALVETFKKEWAKTGKKLDMGKSCIRFKTLEGFPLEVIGKMVGGITTEAYIAKYEGLLKGRVPMKREEIRKMVAERAGGKTKVGKKMAKKTGKKVMKKGRLET